MDSVTAFLDTLGSLAFRVAAVGFVLLNSAAIAAFALTRSRRLVNEWTSKLVTADAILLGVGLGVPLLAAGAKLAAGALGGMVGGVIALFK